MFLLDIMSARCLTAATTAPATTESASARRDTPDSSARKVRRGDRTSCHMLKPVPYAQLFCGSVGNCLPNVGYRIYRGTSVADPHQVDADPDPTFYFDADPDPEPDPSH